MLVFEKILSRIGIRDRHTEGLPAGFFPDLFIVCTDLRVRHCLTEALLLLLLCIVPFDQDAKSLREPLSLSN
jgi:hypothetical protein